MKLIYDVNFELNLPLSLLSLCATLAQEYIVKSLPGVVLLKIQFLMKVSSRSETERLPLCNEFQSGQKINNWLQY